MALTEHPFFQKAEVRDGLIVWHISGVIDDDRIDELKNTLLDLVESGHCDIIMDFGGLQAITSRGLGFLITAQKETRSREGRLALVNLSAQFAPLFELTRLNRILEIFLDMDTALRSFGTNQTETP
jgi:anti-sigma B factor antagonist